MKIGLIGAQGTGKTSVAEAWVKDPEVEAKKWKVVPSVSRRLMNEGYKINKEADPLSQLLTTAGRVSAEFRMEAEDPSYSLISDRTPLDSLAYTAYQAAMVWKSEYNDAYWDISSGFVLDAMNRYDLVVYFPIYWDVIADTARSDDVMYQANINLLIRKLMASSAQEYIVMPHLSVADRVLWLKHQVFGLDKEKKL